MELHIGSLVKAEYPKKLVVDCQDLEEADDGSTTYFGGSVKVGDKDMPAFGNDRGDNYEYSVYEAIQMQFGIGDYDALYDALDGAGFVLRSDEWNEIEMPTEGSDEERLAAIKVTNKQYKKVLEK